MRLRKSTTSLAGAAALVVTALTLAACGGSDTGATPTTASGSPATIGVADGDLGKILVDSQGRTLYLFQKDSGTKSTCFGKCAVNWPPLRVSGRPTEGSGANPALVGTTSRPGGKPQVTYNGHPLYLFAGRQERRRHERRRRERLRRRLVRALSRRRRVAPPANGGDGGYGY